MIEKEAVVSEMQTDKAMGELMSQYQGTISEVLVEEGDIVNPDDPIIALNGFYTAEQPATATPIPMPAAPVLKQALAATPVEELEAKETLATFITPRLDRPVKTMPKTRQYAKERGVDIDQVLPNEEGYVTPKEIDAVFNRALAHKQHDFTLVDQWNPDYFQYPREDEARRELTYIRQFDSSTAEQSHKKVPPFTLFDEVDVKALRTLYQE
ncbi:MAG: biotin/lipoyl-containing protein [Aerococcus sp.]|nr:biotin/lipoyl-containing protein [Aerococcus sp.]